mmetsp:Transcript_129213/g.374052  ORF Transcript_129213/g.374052 Transcript_129213/m.374052 type:complete len:241 (+) Transcript_129213:937-1659(+)
MQPVPEDVPRRSRPVATVAAQIASAPLRTPPFRIDGQAEVHEAEGELTGRRGHHLDVPWCDVSVVDLRGDGTQHRRQLHNQLAGTPASLSELPPPITGGGAPPVLLGLARGGDELLKRTPRDLGHHQPHPPALTAQGLHIRCDKHRHAVDEVRDARSQQLLPHHLQQLPLPNDPAKVLLRPARNLLDCDGLAVRALGPPHDAEAALAQRFRDEECLVGEDDLDAGAQLQLLRLLRRRRRR